jgi:hypothetical protein
MFPGPNVSARDSSGNQVWLLNEVTADQIRKSPVFGEPLLSSGASYYRSGMATSSSARHDCFKEQDFQFEHRPFYPDHSAHQQYHMDHDRVRIDSSYFDSYEGVSYANRASLEKGPKRYPCRFRESHGCDKTFTTSGHASRHSKIHTAEKAVRCTHPGCEKKFNRADNMKQHLETHYKSNGKYPEYPSF